MLLMRQEIPVRFIWLIFIFFFWVLAAYFIPLYAKKRKGGKKGGENLNERLEQMSKQYWEFCFDVT